MTQEAFWSDPEIKRLKELLGGGKSYAQTARALTAEFGRTFSRNAVGGKADRLEINKPDGPSAPAVGLRAPPVKPQGHNPLGNITRASFAKAPPVEAPRKSCPPDSIALEPKAITDPAFRANRCKWPILARSAEGDICFCQNGSEGRTYCAEHARYSAERTMPKAAKAAQDAVTAANRKAGAATQKNQLVFSPRAA